MCSCGQSRRVVKDTMSTVYTTDFSVNIRRAFGFNREPFSNAECDPFLLVSEWKAEEPTGFPDHPHRGYQMINYILKGALRTEDFKGHEKTVNAGDVQLITAGRAIVHCEMPVGPVEAHGLQIWVNVPAKDKMATLCYKEISEKQVPKVKKDGVSVKVITGEAQGLKSTIHTHVPTMILEVKMDPKSTFSQPLPKNWTAFIFIISGTIHIGPDKHTKKCYVHTTLLLNDHGAHVDIYNKEKTRAHFLLLSGQPIKEPVFQHGPLIMSTEEEMKEAIEDVTKDRNGFEGGREWESFIVREDDIPI